MEKEEEQEEEEAQEVTEYSPCTTTLKGTRVTSSNGDNYIILSPVNPGGQVSLRRQGPWVCVLCNIIHSLSFDLERGQEHKNFHLTEYVIENL